MALEYQGVDLSYVATQAIGQFRAVRLVAEGTVSLPSAAKGGPIIGITQDSAAASGDVVRVRRSGLSKARFATSATVGQTVAAHDTAGNVGVPTAAWSSGDDALGQVEQAVSTSGDIAAIWVNAREIL